MSAVSEGLPLIVLVLLGLLWFLPGARRRERRLVTVWSVLAMLLSLGLSQVPVLFYYRARPFLEHEVTALVPTNPAPSFPGLHAAASAALATVFSGHSRWLGYGAWALALVVMYARVHVGVHYPSDVVGGALLGWLPGVVVRQNRDLLRAFAEQIVETTEHLF